VPGHSPGEQAVLQFLFRRRALGDHLEIVGGNRPVVARLDQHAPGNGLERQPAPARIGQGAAFEEAQVLFLREDFPRFGGNGRRNDHLGEDRADRFGGRGIELGVDRDDASEGRNAVTRQRRFPRGEQRGPLRNAARVGVLDDHDRRFLPRKLCGEFQRGIGIVEVVVGQLLALKLDRLRNARGARHLRHIDRRRLVRVFAIAQRIGPLQRDGQRVGEGRALAVGIAESEPAGDRAVIGGGARIGLARHPRAEGLRGRAGVGVHFLDQCCVIGRVGEDRHEAMVLRRRAHHRRAANVDILDDVFAACALRHGRLEGIEVDHHQIDRADPVGLHRGDMLGIVAQGEQPAVDGGVQGLHPPVHHLGEPGEVRDVLHRQTRIAQGLGGAAGADQLHAPLRQRAAQIGQTALVGHRKQCPLDHTISHAEKPILSS